MNILLSKRGNTIISVPVIMITALMVVAFAFKIYPAFIIKQHLDTYATELVRVAEISGRVGEETTEKVETLNNQYGFSPTISWNKTGNIQLNDTVEVTCTITRDLGLFGNIGTFPVTLTGRASGQSEVYWK